MLKKTDINYLPTCPGCYLFKNNGGKVIYVGKAKDLKKRISSYFTKKDLDPKTALLVTQIENIDIIATNSESEALLLENSLIKKYYPHFNLDLKDSRRYAYILIHDGEFPWIEIARTRDEKGDYYGPFTSGTIRKTIMDTITRTFKILSNKPSPKLKKLIDKNNYLERVKEVKKILKGDVDNLIDELNAKMKESSTKTNYEYALALRDKINALKTLKEKQIIEMTRSVDAIIINYKIIANEVYLLVFSIRKGVLEGKQAFNFDYYEDFFTDFLIQYFDSAPIPQELILPINPEDSIKEFLENKRNKAVSIIIPQKGEKKDLLNLVEQNIDTTFFVGSENIKELQKILNLQKLPRTIECFDISHLGGTNTVASMVTFEDGLPKKSSYRKFKIKDTSIGDDFAAITEVIRRRYSGSLTKTMKNPDLIMIDGGKPQINAAHNVLKELRISTPLISLAKKFEEIYTLNNENSLRIDKKNKGLLLLESIRDEAHRFAISYQRLLRKKEIK